MEESAATNPESAASVDSAIAEFAKEEGSEQIADKAAEVKAEGVEEESKEAPKKSRREEVEDRFRSLHADQQFENEDELYDAADSYLNELLDYRERNSAANKELVELFESQPALVQFILDLKRGASLREAVAMNLSPEDLALQEGDGDEEKMKAAVSERERRLEEKRKLADEYDNNMKATLAEIESFKEENELDDDGVTSLLEIIDSLYADFAKGKVSKKFLSDIHRSLSYDKDVAKAEEVGRINGRNESIEVKKAEPVNGDGLPAIGGAGSTKSSPIKKSALASLGIGIEDEESPLSKLKLK